MIDAKTFLDMLAASGISFFSGVPDSAFKDFCACLLDSVPAEDHIINANEGSSVALAAGYYLATGKIAMVYMQNSGLGNAINPLLSLADPDVYGIPILLLIGWRGEPGKKDEPQHVKDGRVMLKMLEAMEIPYEVIGDSIDSSRIAIEKAFNYMREKSAPYALIAKVNAFEKYISKSKHEKHFDINREDAIKIIIDNLSSEDIIISTTGKTSRELFEYREFLKQGHQNDFLTIGSMGHCSQIALGLALKKPTRQVYCLDGDGAILMHMGSLAIAGTKAPKNFRHIVINNGVHDSVGGQPTAGFDVDLKGIAAACGYKAAYRAESADELRKAINVIKSDQGPVFLEVRVNAGAREDLGRPTIPPSQNKKNLMELLRK